MRRLGDAIGLREGEGPRIARLFVFVLALMVAIAVAKAAQRGLFLAAFSREQIPDAFAISALCLAASSFAVSALAARVGPARLIQILFAVVAVALIGCWSLRRGRWWALPSMPAAPSACCRSSATPRLLRGQSEASPSGR